MAEKKHQIHEFDPKIYPRLVWVTVGAPTSVLKDMFESGMEDMDSSNYAVVINTRRTKPDVRAGVLIRFCNKEAMTTGNIAHEASHAAMEILDYIGAEVDLKNQEYFSYLCGWIADCCQQVKSGKFKD